MGAQPQTERRWVATAWGGSETWRFEDFMPAVPGPGEVTIRVQVAGMNPADAKHMMSPRPGVGLPVPIGYEAAGELTAIGPGTRIGSGEARIGDPVLAFRIQGAWATAVTVPAEKVFARPATLAVDEAANLLLAGSTAADELRVVEARAGETILVHAASGAVGVAVLQLAVARGIRVIGTAGPSGMDRVRAFGGVPVPYGPGLVDRVRAVAAGDTIAAALDGAGTTEALDASLELVSDPRRIVTIVGGAAAQERGIRMIAGSQPESAAFRDSARPELIALAAEGRLRVPIAKVFPLEQARAATDLLLGGHPGGKLVLRP